MCIRDRNKSATTDANGKYQFDGLELGTYNMAVSKPGYQAFSGEVKVEDKENNVKDIEPVSYTHLVQTAGDLRYFEIIKRSGERAERASDCIITVKPCGRTKTGA